MLTLAYPWLMALVATPLLLRWWLPAYHEQRPAVRAPFAARLADLVGRQLKSNSIVARATWVQQIMQWASFALLIVALCRPQWVQRPITKTIPMRDLMLAIDLSGSMETKDFTNEAGQPVERLTAVKQVLKDFLQQRKEDRIGLIFFGTSPFLQAPFSDDHVACQTLLDEAQVRMCGPKTAFGDAIGLSVSAFKRSTMQEHVLIVLTDGNDTASQVPPEKAAEIAKDNGIIIYCIGVGDPTAAGEEKFDEAALREVAHTTGGDYFHANNRTELTGIYQKLDQLQPRKVQTISHRPKVDLYYVPLALMLIVQFFFHIGATIRRGSLFLVQRVQAPRIVVHPSVIAAFPISALSFQRLEEFHFLRPLWLLALVPIAGLVWLMTRERDGLRNWRGLISAHLLPSLIVGQQRSQSWRPLGLLTIVWCLCVISIAGPTSHREPAPFAEDSAALVIVVKCAPTMQAQDVQPSRQTRAAQKIHDLLAARPGTLTALVAYAGQPHLVMPFTSDAGAIDYFAEALSPDIMPAEGDSSAEAIQLAQQMLVQANKPGSILLITDGVTPAQVSVLQEKHHGTDAPVNLLGVATEKPQQIPLNDVPSLPLDRPTLTKLATELGGHFTKVTPDDADIHELVRTVRTHWRPASEVAGGERWQEAGYWLTPILFLVCLAWFQPGWMVTYE